MASVDVIIRTIDQGSGAAVGFARKMGTAWKNLATPLNQTLELFDKIGEAAGAAIAAVGEGADVAQTTASFDRLNETLWQTPNLLKQMQEASRGTISEVKLMSGLMTLAAGASEELSKSYATSAPALLEMAKAANKLNPALGSTEFLYDSISKGIKRQSPLILDNLGIVVKAEKAYGDYAKKVGKSVSALDGMEKQMAFLEATMKAGDVLIGQVGGSVDALGDPIARMNTLLEDTKNNMLAAFAGEVVGGIDDVGAGFGDMTEDAEAFGEAMGKIATGAIPLLVDAAEALAAALGQIGQDITFQEDLDKAISAGIISVDDASALVDQYNWGGAGQKAAIETLSGYEEAWQAETNRFDLADDFFIRFAKAGTETLGEAATRQAQELADRMSEMGRAGGEAFAAGVKHEAGRLPTEIKEELGAFGKAMQDGLDAEAGRYVPALWNQAAAIDQARQDAKDLADEAIKAQEEALEAAKVRSGDYFTSAIEFQEADPSAVYDVNAALLAQADAAGASGEALALLGVATGQFTEEQAEAALKAAALQEKIGQLGAAIAEGMDIGTALEDLRSFQSEIEGMTFDVNPTLALPEDDIGRQLEEWYGNATAGAAGAAGDATDIAVTAGVDYTQAETDISVMQETVLQPLIDDEYEITIEALVDGALGSIGHLKAELDSIPRNINVNVTVHKQGIPSTTQDAVAETIASYGE